MPTAETSVAHCEVADWFSAQEPSAVEALLRRAYVVKCEHIGRKVHFRGIIEFSNVCEKNCFYCGIRRDNTEMKRYRMDLGEILECARFAHEAGYGSVVLQAGERQDADFATFVERVIHAVKAIDDGALGITLSVGEQSEATYRRWFEAGAHRYLLRIETSNPRLYARLHPADHSWDERRRCLAVLRDIGYQVGTGVMIGLPFQTGEDLAGDIEFFRAVDIDMIGMGPYVRHAGTPLGVARTDNYAPKRQLDLALRMIALTRLAIPDVNIAATTALQALHPEGREMGLKAGANILMPNLTPTRLRRMYQLYDGKPCLDETADMCGECLSARIAAIGEEIGYGKWGDAPHYFRRTGRDDEQSH